MEQLHSDIGERQAPVRTEPLPLEFPGAHYMGEDEIEAVTRVLRSKSPFRYYGIDPQGEAAALEAEFARYVGRKHALAVTSGTAALHVALGALGVGPGQEVIIPAYMWVAVPTAVVNRGAIPVVSDIDETFCLDPEQVERAITPKTTGIILVHMSGAVGDAPAIAEIARRRGLFLLEDCAQCGGGFLHGKSVGTFGDAAIFSFQINKNMTTGEGGCVVTDDDRLYHRAVAAHDLGYAKDENGQLIFDVPDYAIWGNGYRMDELRAAVARVQLRKLPAITSAMRRSKYRIREALAQFPEVRFRRILDPAGDCGGFLLTIYDSPEIALRVNRGLAAEGIRTFPQGVSNVLLTDWGLHLYYLNVSLVERRSVDANGFPWRLAENQGLGGSYGKGACPCADSLFERTILLPIPSCLTERDENDIIAAFHKVLRSLR